MATELFNGTRPENLFIYVNTITDGHFGWVILVAIAFATFMGLGFLKVHQALAGAAYLTGILAVFFYVLGIINILYINYVSNHSR